jgi:hypothetical protein
VAAIEVLREILPALDGAVALGDGWDAVLEVPAVLEEKVPVPVVIPAPVPKEDEACKDAETDAIVDDDTLVCEKKVWVRLTPTDLHCARATASAFSKSCTVQAFSMQRVVVAMKFSFLQRQPRSSPQAPVGALSKHS